jgi:hypothetical protein
MNDDDNAPRAGSTCNGHCTGLCATIAFCRTCVLCFIVLDETSIATVTGEHKTIDLTVSGPFSVQLLDPPDIKPDTTQLELSSSILDTQIIVLQTFFTIFIKLDCEERRLLLPDGKYAYQMETLPFPIRNTGPSDQYG